jgi:hypothetical protein
MGSRVKTLLFAVVRVGTLKRKLTAGIALCLTFMAVGVLPAFAHQPTLSSAVVCNEQTGDYDVTWTIANGNFGGSIMTLEQSSRPAVPLSSYAPNESKSYVESLPGSTTGATTLTIRAGWDDGAPDVVASTTVHTDGTCSTEPEPGIDVTKSCPGNGLVGDELHYTITVTNTGDEDLANLVVTDTVDGHPSVPVPGAPSELEAGDSIELEFTYTVQEGDDESPLSNSVTATATGVTSGEEVESTSECETVISHPEITVEKTCPPLAHVGDELHYTITVTNTGDEDLANLVVTDTVDGHPSVPVPGAPSELEAGDSIELEFTYTVQEGDDDPLPNSVTASATGVISEASVESIAGCVTDIIHPGILIEKSVDEDLVPVGTTVTYTYVVTNTGDTTLYDVSVDDDVLGHIGDIPVLEPGDENAVTLTKDFVVGVDPVTNVATASGDDVLGHTVSSTDTVVVTSIAGGNTPPPTPFTGSDARRLGLVAMGLFGIGATLVAVTRRRRSQSEEA